MTNTRVDSINSDECSLEHEIVGPDSKFIVLTGWIGGSETIA